MLRQYTKACKLDPARSLCVPLKKKNKLKANFLKNNVRGIPIAWLALLPLLFRPIPNMQLCNRTSH